MIKRKMILGAAFMLLMSIWLFPQFTDLNIVVRDANNPSKAYSSTNHNFWVFVFNCDYSIFTIKGLTGLGPGGGGIYGNVKVPNGCYLIVGIASCKNVWTNWEYVDACCGKEVCVNLIPRTFQLCASELKIAIQVARSLNIYSFSSPPMEISKEMREDLGNAEAALTKLMTYFPKYNLDISYKELMELEKNNLFTDELFKKNKGIEGTKN